MNKKQKLKTRRQPVVLIFLLIVLCSLFFTTSLFAQQRNTAAYEMETLLNTSEVTYGQAIRFILEASEKAVIADAEEAFRYVAERNWISKKIASGQIARLDVLSVIFMKAFDMKGGIFYSLTGRPRYAYRELVYLNLIQGRTEPGKKVSGELLLFVTSRIITYNQMEAAQ